MEGWQGFGAEGQQLGMERISAQGRFSSGFSRSQAFQVQLEGCDHQRRPSLARLDVGQPVSAKDSGATGPSYQAEPR
jgi:hypothetical protein